MPTEDDFEAKQESSVELTNSQINRLGDRLRKGVIREDDRRLLDAYRRSFTEAYATVVGEIRDRLKLEVTGRPAKTTKSIVEKLRREKTRLSQMQDIAGCRIVLADVVTQNQAVKELTEVIRLHAAVDRRVNPSHGYRAVHVIAESAGKLVEIQLRTSLQHLWAEVSEKLADLIDPSIKYGGDREIEISLSRLSKMIADVEYLQVGVAEIKMRLIPFGESVPEELRRQLTQHEQHIEEVASELSVDLRELVDTLSSRPRTH